MQDNLHIRNNDCKSLQKKTLKNKFCSVQLITSIVASSPTVTLKIEANISYLTHIIIWGNSIVEIILVNKFEGSQVQWHKPVISVLGIQRKIRSSKPDLVRSSTDSQCFLPHPYPKYKIREIDVGNNLMKLVLSEKLIACTCHSN